MKWLFITYMVLGVAAVIGSIFEQPVATQGQVQFYHQERTHHCFVITANGNGIVETNDEVCHRK